MKFLIDAQLPNELSEVFKKHECECVHVMTLPKKDRSSDKEIREHADRLKMIVVTKDFDFYHSHMSLRKPGKLLLITTGNIKNKQLLNLFEKNLKAIVRAFKLNHFVELSNDELIVL